MKLTEITVNRFRGYLDKTTIPIGPHLTVLFGPNGYGKSTIIDGVEWLLSSQISRYVGYEEGRREDYLKHVDAQAEPLVELKFNGTDRQILLRRERISIEKTKLSVGDADNKWLDSDLARSVLSNLDSNVSFDQLKSYTFSDPFVSFHLLGQETLRGFVESDPRDRLERLAPIIGVHKFTELTESLIGTSRLLSARSDELSRQLTANKKELDALEHKKTSVQETYEKGIQGDRNLSEWLREEFASFQSSLPDRLRSKPENIRQEDLREFVEFLEQYLSVTLAGIAQHHAETKSRLDSAEELIKLGTTIQDRTNLALSHRERVHGQAEELQKAVLARQIVEGRVNTKTNDLKTLGITQSKLQKDEESLVALKSTLETAAVISTKLNLLTDKRRAIQEQLSIFNSRIENAGNEKTQTQKALSDCLERTRIADESLVVARALNQSGQELLRRTSQLASTQDGLAKLTEERASLTARLRETHSSLQEADNKDRQAQLQFRASSQNADKYHSLLAELRQFVADSRCPFCSTEFESRQDLLVRVDERLVGADPQLEVVAAETRRIANELTSLRTVHQSLSEQLQSIEQQIADSTTQIEDFNRLSQMFGNEFHDLKIGGTADLQSALPALQQHMTALQQGTAEFGTTQRSLESRLKTLDEEYLKLLSGAKSSQAELAATDIELVEAQKDRKSVV
jgi:DNA repair protein SbcC/Rad50